MFEHKLVKKAKMAKSIIEKLDLDRESAKQIKSALALEILGEEFEMQGKYSKAVFVKTQGAEVMQEIRALLEDEGVLTKKRLTNKGGN